MCVFPKNAAPAHFEQIQPMEAPRESVFAPSWDTSQAPDPVARPNTPKSFEQAFEQNADRIAGELELDTEKLTPEPKQAKQAQPKEPKEAKQEPTNEWQKKYKELESLSGTKLREAAQAKKQAEQVIQQAQRAMQIEQELQKVLASKDPEQLLRAVGFDPEQYRQNAIERAYRESQLSPEQREIEGLREQARQAETYKQQVAEQQKKHQQLQLQQQQEVATNQAAQNLGRAFMSTAQQLKLPTANPGPLNQRFANALAGARGQGLDPTFAELGQAVDAQYFEDVVSYINEALTPERFEKFPPQTKQKLRQFFLRQPVAAAPTGTPPSGPQAPRQAKQKTMGIADYNSYLDTLRRG
jgi:hypothetical protein